MGGEVVSGECHLFIFRQLDFAGNVGSSDESLGSVAGLERLGSATFIGLEDVHFSLEVSSNVLSTGLDQTHSSLDVVLSNSSQEDTTVVSGSCGVHLLVESLDTCDSGSSGFSLHSDEGNVLVKFALTCVDCSSNNSSSSRNVVCTFNRHHEVSFDQSLRFRNFFVHSVNQLFNSRNTYIFSRAFKSLKG